MILYAKAPPGSISNMIRADPGAWNLAFLSHDFSTGPHPDPMFPVNVRRTLQTELATGRVDLLDLPSKHVKFRALMAMPAPQAVRYIVHLPHLRDLAMFRAYGLDWIGAITRRSWLYEEPHHSVFDAPLTDFSAASAALRRHMLPR